MHSRFFDELAAPQRRELVREVHHRQGGVCFICEEELDLREAGARGPKLHHIQPLRLGGADSAANLAVNHAECLRSKTVRDLRVARAMTRLRRDTARLAPREQADEGPAGEGDPGGSLSGPVVPAAWAAAPVDQRPLERAGAEPPPMPEEAPSGTLRAEASESRDATEVVDAEPDEEIDRDEETDREEATEAAREVETPELPMDKRRRSYASALALTVLGAVVPGTAFLAAGRRRLGLITLGIVVLLLLVPIGVLLIDRDLAKLVAELASRPALLDALGVDVLVAAAVWIIVIAAGYRMLLPRDATARQKVLGGGLTLLLAVVVAVPSIIVARYAFATRDLIDNIFDTATADGEPPGTAPPIDRDDPWKDLPRLNLLLVGGDSTDDGGMITNTMIVASVDTATGDTVLFGLPRNLQNAPIPADNPLNAIYPSGYRCGVEPTSCLLSGLYTEATVRYPDLFVGDADPGLTTLRGSVSEITGLDIHYYMLVDLVGLEQLVDALDGIDINVGPEPVPIARLDAQGTPLPSDASTRYIPPGLQHLTGEEALAFARERRSDTSSVGRRILRQRLVISAMIDRATNPVNILLSYLEVTSSASDAIRTDVPAALLPGLVDLSDLVRAQEIRTVPITDQVTLPTNPDFAQIRLVVQRSLTPGGA